MTERNHVFDAVFDFNEQIVGIKTPYEPAPLTEEQATWTQRAYSEEISEFRDAHEAQDVVACVDATIDLIYFAVGTLRKLGLTKEQAHACFMAVHNANLTKKRGRKNRGSDEDAIKPEGFVSPEEVIWEILFGGRV